MRGVMDLGGEVLGGKWWCGVSGRGGREGACKLVFDQKKEVGGKNFYMGKKRGDFYRFKKKRMYQYSKME